MVILQNILANRNYNLFLGAGISKKEPSYAPIWRELLEGFINGLYDKIKLEKWPALEGCNDHVNKLLSFSFRPETFWEFCQNNLSREIIGRFLQVLDLGSPNLNHVFFKYLLSKSFIRNIITTNFDLYLEDSENKVVYNSKGIQDILNNDNAYKGYIYKIHGTLIDSSSLQFNLEDTKLLSASKMSLLDKMLSNYPLMICGYSGYDDDILPALEKIIPRLPEVLIISHPGSPVEEPIRKLPKKYSNVYEYTTDINVLIEEWVKNNMKELKSKVDQGRDYYLIYNQVLHETFNDIIIPKIPYFLSKLYDFCGYSSLANYYALLAQDAVEDSRYEEMTPYDLRISIKRNLSGIFAKSPQPTILPSEFFFRELSNEKDERYSFSEVLETKVDYAFSLIKKNNPTEQEIELATENLEIAYGMLKAGLIKGTNAFTICWAYGRLKSRKKDYISAVSLYTEGLKKINTIDELDKVTQSSFQLDLAASVYNQSLIELNDDLLKQAHFLYKKAVELAENIKDYENLSKSLKGWALIEFFSMEFDKAKELILLSLKNAENTGNHHLIYSISQTKDFIYSNTPH